MSEAGFHCTYVDTSNEGRGVMSKPETLVIPGLGSPESQLYRKVYDLLASAARQRDMPMRCLRYEGHGHLANGRIDGEIELPGVAQGIADQVRQSPMQSTLVCRSFGCLLPGYLALHHDLKLQDFRRIALWGPVPYFHMWKLFGTAARVAEKNSEAEAKGARLAPDFFQSITPLEASCEALLDTEVVIAVGTADGYTTPAFAEFLATIVRGAGNPNVNVRIVENAPHEMTAAQGQNVITDYLNALFE